MIYHHLRGHCDLWIGMDKNRLEGCRLMEESSSRGEATFYGGARGGETAALEINGAISGVL